MSRRTFYQDTQHASQGIVQADFSFLTNNTSDPALSGIRGGGGQTGSDVVGSVSNTGPSVISSITRTGVGAYLVTFKDGYRYASSVVVSIDDAADQLAARNAPISNEGSGHETPITMAIVVRSAGTATESTGRRISCTMALKNSGNGT